LNNLPPASQTVATNYPLSTREFNYTGQVYSLLDLKSTTLSILLEQMGLAQPTRHIFALKQWTPDFLPDLPFYDQNTENSWIGWAVPDYIVQRNFDPQTLEASTYVNQSLFFGVVESGSADTANFMGIYIVDPETVPNPAVADANLLPGQLYGGLTYDDVGGLCYLLSPNNVNFETLLPGIFGVGTNANSFVNGAWRPGVDKITLIQQPLDETGTFISMTNQFTDTYVTNGVLMRQQLARVISQPDLLFSAKIFPENFSCPDVRRTGTTNWINNANLNGNPAGAGPGVIVPHINIAYNIAGRQLWHDSSMSDLSVEDETMLWASFDATTNIPVIYPVPLTGTNQMTIRMLVQMGSYASDFRHSFEWTLAGPSGALHSFQTSTDLLNWSTLFVVTNNGAVCDFFNWNPSSSQRFYRLAR